MNLTPTNTVETLHRTLAQATAKAEAIDTSKFCCWKVDHDLMNPLFKKGDIVIVEKLEHLKRPLKRGNIVLYRVNNEFSIRYIESLEPLRLLSSSDEMPPLEISDSDKPHTVIITKQEMAQGMFEIIGKVINKMRFESISTIWGSNDIY